MKEEKRNLEQLDKEYKQLHMSEQEVNGMKEKIEQAKAENERRRKRTILGKMTAIAAAAVLVVLPNLSSNIAYAMSNIPILGKLVEVVTFRDYQYEDERHRADIEVPEIVAGTSEPEKPELERLGKTAEEINSEVQKITDQIVKEFEVNAKDKEGYQDVMVKHEVISTTDQYFTLKLICYQGAGSGAEWDYFYTIDLQSGERIALKDLFQDGSDYITPISENIKKQMRNQMAADERIKYWVDETDVPAWNFQTITDETSFYVNSNNQIVIAFNEGDVAPMAMGCVEFVIEEQAVAGIRR